MDDTACTNALASPGHGGFVVLSQPEVSMCILFLVNQQKNLQDNVDEETSLTLHEDLWPNSATAAELVHFVVNPARAHFPFFPWIFARTLVCECCQSIVTTKD